MLVRTNRSVGIVVAVGCFVLVALALVPAGAAPKTQDVNVVNTPTVNLAPGSLVGIDSAANEVSLEDDATVQVAAPEQWTDSAEWDGLSGTPGSCSQKVLDLPVGQPLLLEKVTVSFVGPAPEDNPAGHVTLYTLDPEAEVASPTTASVPLHIERDGFGSTSGVAEIGAVVVGAPNIGETMPGEIYHVEVCLNRGSGHSGSSASMIAWGTLLP